MEELVEIEQWMCVHNIESGTRSASRSAPAGEWHAWLTADGALDTEFRPSEPDDDRREVKLPAAVVDWLIAPLRTRARASSVCPVCSHDAPHAHTQSEIEAWLTSLVTRWGYARVSVFSLAALEQAWNEGHRAADAVSLGGKPERNPYRGSPAPDATKPAEKP